MPLTCSFVELPSAMRARYSVVIFFFGRFVAPSTSTTCILDRRGSSRIPHSISKHIRLSFPLCLLSCVAIHFPIVRVHRSLSLSSSWLPLSWRTSLPLSLLENLLLLGISNSVSLAVELFPLVYKYLFAYTYMLAICDWIEASSA